MDYRSRGRGAHASFERSSTGAWPDDDGRRPDCGHFDTDDGHRGAHRDPGGGWTDRYPQGGRHRGAEPRAEPPGRGRSAHPGRPVTDPTDWRPDTFGGRHADAAEYVPDAHPGAWESLGYARDWQAPIGGGGRRRADETGAWGRSHYSTDPQPSDRAGAYQPPDRHPLADPGEWDRSDTGQWDLSAGDGTRGSSAGAGKWDWFADTGQWHRFTDTGEWCSDLTDLDPPVDDDAPGNRPRHSRPDAFWSGTRLAGDDPRWMETPTSAPRSPAVADPIPPGSGPESPPRPRMRTPPRRTVAPPGLLHAQPGSLLASVLYTAAWYAVPLLVFFVWMLTLDASLPLGCGTAVPGGDCESGRTQAVGSILAAGPRFGGALLASLVVSVLLRWANRTWRAASVGLAAAVIGGGLSTLLVSVISGRPLG